MARDLYSEYVILTLTEREMLALPPRVRYLMGLYHCREVIRDGVHYVQIARARIPELEQAMEQAGRT